MFRTRCQVLFLFSTAPSCQWSSKDSKLDYQAQQLEESSRKNEIYKKKIEDLTKDIQLHKEVEISFAEKNRKLVHELMKYKNEVLSIFKSFHAMIRTQFSAKIQILCSNNIGEYVNYKFQQYFQAHSLYH